MKLNDTAAAYGLFQVVFADLTTRIAIAALGLRERYEPGLTFQIVFSDQFKQMFGKFKDELKRFEGRLIEDNLRDIREACTIISDLAEWRNDRIHARVQMSADGYALYDWRTRKRLELDSAQIEKRIELPVKAIVALEANVQYLVHQLKWEDEFEKFLSLLPD